MFDIQQFFLRYFYLGNSKYAPGTITSSGVAIIWFFIRILTGISIAGIFVIMESWLNEKSTNSTRGSILSIYMIILII